MSGSEFSFDDLWAEMSPEASGDTSSASEPNSSSGPETDPAVRVRRRPIPRKGHTKSRLGCYNCKRRKVKCQENLPECYHCKRIGLKCEYPLPKNQPSETPRPSNALQSTPTLFAMDDMNFFQHFLLVAYPALPVGGTEVWRGVAPLAHSFDFLIHSMLALGAQHLSLCTNQDFTKQAISHRIQAIKALNVQLSKPNPSKAEGDAAFAAVMSLTFQSSYMADGMLEFISMIRGCHIVAMKAMPNFQQSAFATFSREEHVSSVENMMDAVGMGIILPGFEIQDGFIESCRSIAPMCKSVIELQYLADLQKVMNLAQLGSPQAYGEYAKLYNVIGEMSNEDWIAFSDPQNYTSQLLLVHFFLLDYVMNGSLLHTSGAAYMFRQSMTILWMERIASKIPPQYKKYVEWPLQRLKTLSPENGWPQSGYSLRTANRASPDISVGTAVLNLDREPDNFYDYSSMVTI